MSRFRTLSIAALAASYLCLAGQAARAGTLTYTGQTRAIVAHAFTKTDQTASAADFGPFNASVSNANASGTNGSASQVSQLTPTGVTMSGYLSGTTRDGYGPYGYGQSRLEAYFTLDAASPYAINAAFTGGLISVGSSYSCSLTDVSTNTSVFASSGPSASPFIPPLPHAGTLPAGSYRLNFFAVHQPYNGNLDSYGSYTASFALTPEPASLSLFAVAGVGLLARRRSN